MCEQGDVYLSVLEKTKPKPITIQMRNSIEIIILLLILINIFNQKNVFLFSIIKS